MRALVLLFMLGLMGRVSYADPPHWYEGPEGIRRQVSIARSAVGGALYFTSETFLKSNLAPSECRWCDPWGYDRAIRDALLWTNTSRAGRFSDYGAFVLSPVLGLGLTMVASADSGEGGWSRWIDDGMPIIESAIASLLVDQGVKFIAGRQRPFVHFGDPARPPATDDNLSFYSGHTTLAFSIATSAGVVAHLRHYRLEPVIWASGYMIAATTGYLRMAADKHYFSDVAVAAIAGAGFGLALPLLHHKTLTGTDLQATVTVTGREVWIIAQF